MLVLHSLPGRIRIRNSYLYDRELSQCIGVYCENVYGVQFCRVNHKTGTILIVYDEEKTYKKLILENLQTAIQSALNGDHMELKPYENYFNVIKKQNKAKRNLILYGIIYILFKIKQSYFGKFSLSRNVQVLKVASIVTIVGGYPLLKGIYKKFAKNMPTDADLLLKLAALSLTISRESTKGVLVLWLKALSDYIKYTSDVECMRSIRQNTEKTSGLAYLVQDDQTVLVPLCDLYVGNCIEIHKGEVIPVKGEIVEGNAVVNNLYYTGQPYAEEIDNGNIVYEGMAVISGDIKVKVIETPDIEVKPDELEKNINIYNKVQSCTKNFTYISLGLAAINYIITRSFLGALSILLVLSPSAKGTAYSSGLKNYVSLLRKNKIYIRNPNVFEKLSKVDNIIFDKTGTLTNGKMIIRQVEVFDKRYSDSELLKICASCEMDNYHPISITLHKASEDYDFRNVTSSVLIPSKGVIAQYDSRRVLIGNQKLMQEYDIDISKGSSLYEKSVNMFCTPVFVAVDQTLAGIIVLKDVLKDSAEKLIRKLKQNENLNIVLLTGDNENNANYIASFLEIETVYSNCKSEDKVKIVNQYKQNGVTMMVGDGVNDILSMRAADISVSFVNSSCDKVKLHSDCIIIEDDMTKLFDMLSLSQKSYRRINQSIFASNAYNVFFGTLAFNSQIDAFAAKSFNTINSLMVLLLNQRINYLLPKKDYNDRFKDDVQEKLCCSNKILLNG